MRSTLQKISQLADHYAKGITKNDTYQEYLKKAFEAGYLAAVEHEKIPEGKLPLPRCYQCSPGVMRPTGAVAMTNPPWHMFKCDKCGTTMDVSQEEFLKIDAKLIHSSKMSQATLNSKKYNEDLAKQCEKIAEQSKESARKSQEIRDNLRN